MLLLLRKIFSAVQEKGDTTFLKQWIVSLLPPLGDALTFVISLLSVSHLEDKDSSNFFNTLHSMLCLVLGDIFHLQKSHFSSLDSNQIHKVDVNGTNHANNLELTDQKHLNFLYPPKIHPAVKIDVYSPCPDFTSRHPFTRTIFLYKWSNNNHDPVFPFN